jgi:S1-C subfamily serine protease
MKEMPLNTIQKYFLLFVILFTTGGLSHAEMKTYQIVEKYSQSVVTIIALDVNNQPLSLGSGFFVNENGDIATNHHVLENCAKAIIKTKKGEKGTKKGVKSAFDPY